QTKEQKERADGNSVDLEQQEIEMARTALNYSYSLQAMSDTFSRLRTAITGK
ncbi:MAG TPA: flagellar basal body rod protein FlgB, partial [Ruminococcaceae bacterium]|nr:flagellar basal body rod protein FlgB [Oscillospiraceae bacterium]